jgi:AAA+ ATPase superfamily predicted ATPase
MKVAGREEEIAILQKQQMLPQSSFVAMYGRRRIGKTYLIREVYAKQIVFDCSGLHEENTKHQLENFLLSLNQYKSKSKKTIQPVSWLQAFDLLKQYINTLQGTEKKIVFLDEISWLDTSKSGFKAALDNFWNQFASKRTDIILVICGSAASWIIDKVINDRGGLHNRITCKIALQPFTLKETAAFLKFKKADLILKDIVQLYITVGGVPFYLNDIEPGQSVAQIIQFLFFSKNARLKNEFENLYAALFKRSGDHITIIKALAAKNKGLNRSQLIKSTGISSGGGLTNTLQELISCGFIREIYPINKTKEDILYRLLDEYSIFYFKFIENSRGTTKWLEIFNTAAYKIWCGFAFENLCLRHIENIKQALGISGISSSEYGWQIKGNKNLSGSQIDLLIDRNDNCINLCETKFYDAVFEISRACSEQLRNKKTLFAFNTQTRKNIFITLITANGAAPNKYYNSIITNQLTIDDLFK